MAEEKKEAPKAKRTTKGVKRPVFAAVTVKIDGQFIKDPSILSIVALSRQGTALLPLADQPGIMFIKMPEIE